MIRAHATAVLDRLAAAAPALTVHDTTTPDVPADVPLPTPYALVIFDSVREDVPGRFTGQQMDGQFGWQVSAVGADRIEAQWAAEKARAAFRDWRPVVAGRACGTPRRVGSEPAFPDRDVTPPVVVAVDRYQFTSVEA